MRANQQAFDASAQQQKKGLPFSPRRRRSVGCYAAPRSVLKPPPVVLGRALPDRRPPYHHDQHLLACARRLLSGPAVRLSRLVASRPGVFRCWPACESWMSSDCRVSRVSSSLALWPEPACRQLRPVASGLRGRHSQPGQRATTGGGAAAGATGPFVALPRAGRQAVVRSKAACTAPGAVERGRASSTCRLALFSLSNAHPLSHSLLLSSSVRSHGKESVEALARAALGPSEEHLLCV